MVWPDEGRGSRANPAVAPLSGNEACARGAWEAGVRVAAAYPGTPSTEILENLARYPEVYCEWSVNEKAALEVAMGASIGGVRAMASMKHVGLNVAADPLFTAAYAGVRAGLVIVSADDPGMHSSQDEQDNRNYASFARLPVFEPSDSQEARDVMAEAFEVSERFDVPVLVRFVTRLAHSTSMVRLGDRREREPIPYRKDFAKYAMLPAHARARRALIDKRLGDLASFSNTTRLNRMEMYDDRIGVVATGVAYTYAREALGERASYLKLGMPWPIPDALVRGFASRVRRLVVIEEGDPFVEDRLRAMGLGIEMVGKGSATDPQAAGPIPLAGELSPESVALALDTIMRELGGEGLELASRCRSAAATFERALGGATLVPRSPVLCPGCPHRGLYYAMSRIEGAIVTGDIGCYALGGLPPLNSIDTCICMGASITNAQGISRALNGRAVFATIGDSTFIHGGITGLINAAYNGASVVAVILDNATTAMTGHQHHPGTGFNAKGEPAPRLDLEAVCRASGARTVEVVDPYDLAATEKALRGALDGPKPSVVISRRACVLAPGTRSAAGGTEGTGGTGGSGGSGGNGRGPVTVASDVCADCGECLGLGCPAIHRTEEGVMEIDQSLCSACGMCAKVCPAGAILEPSAQEGGTGR